MNDAGFSLADIRAATAGNNYDGMGFGGGWFWIIILSRDIVKRMQPYGEMFGMDVVKNMLTANSVPCDTKVAVRYYLCMNMYANDAKQVADENNMPLEKFCFVMAKTFINDIDGGKHKVEKYFMDIISE